MKNLLLSSMLLLSFSATAIEVVSAKLDASQENLLVTVRHGGGCGDHSYELKLQGCAESSPVQCKATIKHLTDDMCEAYLTREAKFSLKKYKLTDKYYANGTLTVSGDDKSKATVTLPSGTSSTSTTKGIRCTTHTGSSLTITSRKVTLVTSDNQVATYQVVKVNALSIETFPSIDQTTYKLDDGRSLQLEFRSNANTGTGEFIRLDGSRSPEFSCTK